jgi:hypothetical protein
MWRMRDNSLSVHKDFGVFRMVCKYKDVIKYAESILVCMENTLKEYAWRIRQECFAEY